MQWQIGGIIQTVFDCISRRSSISNIKSGNKYECESWPDHIFFIAMHFEILGWSSSALRSDPLFKKVSSGHYTMTILQWQSGRSLSRNKSSNRSSRSESLRSAGKQKCLSVNENKEKQTWGKLLTGRRRIWRECEGISTDLCGKDVQYFRHTSENWELFQVYEATWSQQSPAESAIEIMATGRWIEQFQILNRLRKSKGRQQ
jgi:hypothetical protein